MSENNFACDVDVEILISAVKKHECIWNYNVKEYSNKIIKNRAWMDVVQEITPDFENKSVEEKNLIGLKLQSKWKNVKDAFMRYCRNVKKRSGSAASTPRLYPYYEQLLFIKDTAEKRGSTEMDTSISEPLTTEHTQATPGKPTTSEGKRKYNRVEEDRLLEKLTKYVEDKIQQEQQPEPHDEDKLFLLSLLSDFKKISNDYKLDAKAEIIQVIKNYRDTSRYYAGSSSLSHQNNYFRGYSTTSTSHPPPPEHTTASTARPESSLSSYEGGLTSTGVPPQASTRLSSQSRENDLSPESIITQLFS